MERHNVRGKGQTGADGISGRGENTVVIRKTILVTGPLSEMIRSINLGDRCG